MRSRSSLALFVPGLLIALAGACGADEKAHSYSYGNDDHFAYALYSGEEGNFISTNSADWEEVQKLAKGDEPLMWFRLDERTGVIRDPALMERAERACEEMQEIGGEQGKLGLQQGKLGSEQGRLGAEQGRIGMDQSEAGDDLAEISYLITRAQRRNESTADLVNRRERLEVRIRELSSRQQELGRRQRELGAKQSALGRQQSALGERQREASRKARVELEKIVNEAIRRGLVERSG
jgi:bla regulator protein blaR1